MAKFQINILGCGSATPSARHNPTCQVVDFRDKLFMIDCGEGSQSMFRKMGLKFSRLSHIFVSHLHGDHMFGIPGLLSTMSLHDVRGSLTIHIFPDGARLLGEWLDYFNRSSSLHVEFDIIQPGERRVLYEDSGLTVRCFPLYHRVDCTGFIFEEKPKPRHINGEMARFHQVPVAMMKAVKDGADFVRPDGTVVPNSALTLPADPSTSYAYCSDTMFDRRVAADVRGIENIFHEATYDQSNAPLAAERGHSTAAQAANIARIARAKRLIIGHFSKRYNSDESPLIQQASAIFPNTILADEGLRIDLE